MDWKWEIDEARQVAVGQAKDVYHIAEVLPEVLASLLAGPGGACCTPAETPMDTSVCQGVLVDA